MLFHVTAIQDKKRERALNAEARKQTKHLNAIDDKQ